MKINTRDINRFYSKVVFGFGEDACWTWINGWTFDYRGQFWLDGKGRLAYRVSYIIHYGEIPKGMFVLHHCDNPNCVNPEHLFLGNNSDNMKDMFKKGRRNVKGENAPYSKLKNLDVINIRRLYFSGQYKQKQLAKMFGVTSSNISRIIQQETYKDI